MFTVVYAHFRTVNSGRGEVSKCQETSPFRVKVTSVQEVKEVAVKRQRGVMSSLQTATAHKGLTALH